MLTEWSSNEKYKWTNDNFFGFEWAFNRCGNRNPFSTLLKTGEDIGVERNQGFFNNVKSDYFALVESLHN